MLKRIDHEISLRLGRVACPRFQSRQINERKRAGVNPPSQLREYSDVDFSQDCGCKAAMRARPTKTSPKPGQFGALMLVNQFLVIFNPVTNTSVLCADRRP